jgi:hypothetical protein
MKNIILCFSFISILLVYSSCKKKEDPAPAPAPSAPPSAPANGKVEFKSDFRIYNQMGYTVTIGVAKSADDYSKGALVTDKTESGNFIASGPNDQDKLVQFRYVTLELTQATYYYGVTIVTDEPGSTPVIKQKSGLVDVKGGQTASVEFNP